MAGEKILIVDDDTEILEMVSLFFNRNGLHTITAESGEQAVETVQIENPDLIILDICLPGLDGIEACQEIRRKTLVPIIFLSSKTTPMDKIMGLTAGGDDYVVKPFSLAELLARAKAHIRRSRLLTIKQNDHQLIQYPGLIINITSHEVEANKVPVKLSDKEFRLLVLLAQNPNRVFSIEDLFYLVWNTDSVGDTRTLIVHMANLRKKIEEDPSNPKYIITVKGSGYKFLHEEKVSDRQ